MLASTNLSLSEKYLFKNAKEGRGHRSVSLRKRMAMSSEPVRPGKAGKVRKGPQAKRSVG